MERFRRNDFQAMPSSFRGRPAAMTHALPGFHTSSDMDQTLAYAQMKAVDEYSEDSIGDWPVIVALDMAGLRALPDIDGVRMAEKAAEIAKELVRMHKLGWSHGRSIAEELESEADFGDMESEDAPVHGDEVLSLLFAYHAGHIERDQRGRLRDIANEKPDPSAWIKRLARTGKISNKDIVAMSGQMRYEQDVSSDRIIEVFYLKPWWPELIETYDDEDHEELASRLDANGWNVVSVEDSYGDNFYPVIESVFKTGKEAKRLEYHGTSLHNLLSAAPELADVLPRPPAPYTGPFRG